MEVHQQCTLLRTIHHTVAESCRKATAAMLVEKLGSANMAVQETARHILELWLSGSDAVSVLPQLVLAPAHANARLRSQAVSLIMKVSWPSPMQVDALCEVTSQADGSLYSTVLLALDFR